MEIIGLIVLGIIKVLPARAAMPVITVIVLAVAIGSLAWHSSLSAAVDFCNSGRGRFSQLLNGSQTVDCGMDSLLSLVTLIAGIALIVVALLPAAVWIYQLTHPEFDLKEFASDAI